MKPIIVAFCGKTATGKTTLLNEYVKIDSRVRRVVSDTTRPPRIEEKDGRDYHFISPQEFFKRATNKDYLEKTEYRGWHYGTSKNEIMPDVINAGIFDAHGMNVLSLMQDKYTIIPIFVCSSGFTRFKRYLSRGGNIIDYIRREWQDKKTFGREDDFCHWLDTSFRNVSWVVFTNDKSYIRSNALDVRYWISQVLDIPEIGQDL